MASRLDDSDYLSPAKRLKLENNSISGRENVSNCSPEGPTQENNPTLAPEELSHINFEIVGGDLADLPCTSVPTPVSEEQLEDLVEPLGPHDAEANENDDDDEVSSTVSNLSDISGFSDISGLDWKTDNSSSILWIQKQMAAGVNPRDVLSNILGADAHIPAELDESMLWRVVLNMITEPKCRKRLPHIGTFSDVIGLLKKCSKIMVLTGAGVSVSCGIPDFRSRDGIYSRLAVDFPNLPDPQAMFDINYFKQDPRPFFKFAREIYPGQFKPSPCHRFIKMLERHGKLLRNYTQNIDTLEQVAGIENVIECHGSFATASCTRCRHRVSADAIKEDVFAQRIPLCPNPSCAQDSQHNEQSSSPIPRPMSDEPSPSSSPRDSYQRITERGVMKPDIVFFGEGLPESYHSAMAHDKSQADLLIVIGSSLKVRPVALIPNSLPPSVPQILINRERLSHLNFDVELLGDGDVIIDTLCRALEDDWTNVCCRETPLIETRDLNPLTVPTPNLSPVPLFRNVLAGDCSEGEMSIDSTRDSGLGSLVSGDRTDRLSSVDSRMEEDEREEAAATPGRGPKCNPCGNIAVCCPSPVPTSSCSPNEPTNQVAANPCTSNAMPTCHGRPSTSHAISSSSHAHAHHHSVERVSFDSGCNSPTVHMPSPSPETRDCEISLNNIAVEDGRCNNRHMSIDSTRDSGIGEGSNSSNERHMSVDSNSPTSVHRTSLAYRLPENSYYMMSRGCYIFPGAEVMESLCDGSQSDSPVASDASDSEGDEEEEADMNRLGENE